jgi:hypothetical protein
MPVLKAPVITRAWRYASEENRIHYRVVRPDGSDRHLHVDQDHPLYEVLEAHLLALGYTGPASKQGQQQTSE